MSRRSLQRLVREWAALFAVLAFVLGPLALGVTRSLGAAEKIAVAAGLKPPALCLPAAPDGPGGSGPDCDHCLALQSFGLAESIGLVRSVVASTGGPLGRPFTSAAAFPRAPSARGPPTA